MRRVSVASASQLAADAGASIADQGGNAVDAAIGATIVSMCTDPGVIAPGAGGFISIWPVEGPPVVIDAYAEMPGRGLEPEEFGKGAWKVAMEYGGGVETIIGYGSVATPGAFAGLDMASRQYGAIPWPELLEPAIEIVINGFPLSKAAAEYMSYAHDAIFGWDPASRRVMHKPDGSPLAAGDLVHIAGLGETLRVLAEEGVDSLYRGELGRLIAEAIREHEGILTREDLASYRPQQRDPIMFALNGWQIAANPPPAVGGASMAAMLLLLDQAGIDRWDPPSARKLATIQQAVIRYRRDILDSAEDRAEETEALMRMARAGEAEAIRRAMSTSHTSATDTDGAACSITVSAGYGSGAMVHGTGFWLNNSLGEVELHANGFHAVPAGSRLVSNMSPTVARSKDGSVLSIGSPGADRITTALSQVLYNFLCLDMSLRDAIEAPRLHVEAFDGLPTIAYEPGMPIEPFDDFAVRRFPDFSMFFGGAQAALADPVAGLFEAADSRRDGGVARGGAA